MAVLVRAVELGYYDHKRRRIGAEFEVSDADLKYDKSGKLLSPKWVEVIGGSVTKPTKAVRSPKKEVVQESNDEVI